MSGSAGFQTAERNPAGKMPALPGRLRNISYVIPVQAKSGNDRLSRVQIEQDVALCASKLPSLICRPVGVYMMRTDLVALFEFEQDGDDIRIVTEKHYRLVPPEDVTEEDLARYRQRFSDRA